MDTTMIIIIAAAAAALIAVVALIAYLVARSRRRRKLENGFGSEYQRTVAKANGRGAAEADLRERQRRVERYGLRALDSEEAARFTNRWRQVQAEFVDRPGDAVEHADELLVHVLAARGYRSTTTRERIEDISVDHGDEAEDYRLARASAIRNRGGAASTEELRQAMLHFERVFRAVLVATPAPEARAS